MSDLDETYEGALTAAGARVLAFRDFGSYQGDWWARVEQNGLRFWVHGYFGSCSGCDALEAELGDCGYCDDHFEYTNGCPQCQAIADDRQRRLAQLAKFYLVDRLSTTEAMEKAGENAEWDASAEEMVAFIRDTEANEEAK